jgi:hypothetical protein
MSAIGFLFEQITHPLIVLPAVLVTAAFAVGSGTPSDSSVGAVERKIEAHSKTCTACRQDFAHGARIQLSMRD